MTHFTAVFFLPPLQVNATTDPFGAALEKYGIGGAAIIILLFVLRYLVIQQNKQNEANQAQQKKLEDQQEQREKENEAFRREQQERYDKLQNEVRFQLSEQNSDAKEREITLLKKLSDNAELVAQLRVEVAVLQEQAKNYDDRIGFLKLQLEVKQKDFDAAATERKALEDHVAELSNMLATVQQAYNLVNEKYERMIQDQNAIKSQVGELRKDTQTMPAVSSQEKSNTLPVSGTVTLLENPT